MTKSPPPERTAQEKRLIATRIVIVSFVLFFNAVSTSFIDAFLPDIMVMYGAVPDKTHAGKAAAWITAGFCFGRFLAANLWGFFIDRWGRKTGLLLILNLIVLCTIIFGFCNTYGAVLAIRFTTGAVNGLSIVAKTISMEVCPDDFKAWSISVTNSIWALGSITGPAFGSLFFKKIDGYPILAPAIAVTMIGLVLIPACWYFIEETLPPKVEAPPQIEAAERENTSDPEIGGSDKDSNDNVELVNRTPRDVGLCAIPNVGKLMFIFSFNTFYAAVFSGLIIFWVSAKYEDGGLDFAYTDISQVFLYFTLPQILMQILAYPAIQKRMGDYWMLNVGHLLHLPVFFLIPFAHVFGKGNYLVEKFWIVGWLFTRNMASFMNFSALQRFTNDAVSPQKRGRLNGLQVTFSSGLQVLGPLIGKWSLAWSMTNGLGFPFDYHFVFIFMCCLTLIVLGVVNSLKFKDSAKLKLIGESDMRH